MSDISYTIDIQTPNNYTISLAEDLEYSIDVGSNKPIWGTLVGTINNQTDLVETLSTKVDAEEGKGLSENDLTDSLKSNYDTAYTQTHTHGNKTLLDSLVSNGAGTQFLSNDGTYKVAGGGGVVDFEDLGTVTTNVTLTVNKITTGYWSGTNTITLPTVTDAAKQVVCILDFTTATSSQPTITNTNLKWSDKNGGNPPSAYSTISGVQNVLVFKSVWISSTLYWEVEYSSYGGVQTSFTFPNLAANGTFGGATAAVRADTELSSSQAAWKAVDGSNSTSWWPTGSSPTGHYFDYYNPVPFAVTQYNIYNGYSDGGGTFVPTAGNTYYSDDGTNWILETTFTNSITTYTSSWSIPVSTLSYHKYRRIVPTATSNGLQPILTEIRPVGYTITT